MSEVRTTTDVLMRSPDGASRIFAVIGFPIAQVKAPELMNALFAERHVNAVLIPLAIEPSNLATAIEGLKCLDNLDGILVTVPHKFAAFECADQASEIATLAGSVNALRREADGTWSADNFDGTGFVAGLNKAGYSPANRTVALVGAGGAGTSVAPALLAAGAARVLVTDVSAERSEHLVKRLDAKWPGQARSVDYHGVLAGEIIINATPLGLRSGDPLPFEVDQLSHDTIVADIIMKPAETRLLKMAAERGLRIHAGIHMLTEQIELYRQFFRIS